MSELKPCPFCGGEAELNLSGDGDISYHVGWAYVECFHCDAVGPTFDNNKYCEESSKKCEQDAIDAWNNSKSNRRTKELEQALPLIKACYETVRHGGDFDGFDLERELVECGIIEGVPYEPEKHSLIGGEFDLEEGETIYFLTDFWCEILNKQAEEL